MSNETLFPVPEAESDAPPAADPVPAPESAPAEPAPETPAEEASETPEEEAAETAVSAPPAPTPDAPVEAPAAEMPASEPVEAEKPVEESARTDGQEVAEAHQSVAEAPAAPVSEAVDVSAATNPAPLVLNKVLAKFSLSNLLEHRYWQEPGHAVTVELSAVQGEPFGSATPSGSIKMTIANPEAGAFFVDAWHRYVHEGAKAPEFLVLFEDAAMDAPAK